MEGELAEVSPSKAQDNSKQVSDNLCCRELGDRLQP